MHRVARRCWVEPADASDLPALCAAVLNTSTADSVITSVTAARLHGLWLPPLPDAIHVATATPARAGRAMTRTKRPELVAHRMQLPADDLAVVDGLPVLSVARTWRDLAGALILPDLVAAGDSALRGGCELAQLEDVMRRTSRLRYARRAKAALSLLDGRSRSRPESHLRVAVSVVDLPAFAVNEAIFRADGGWLAEPDLSVAEAKLALEYQGENHAEPRRMRQDITRERDLRGEGWLCLMYGPAEVFGRPWSIAPEIRSALAARAPQLLNRSPRVGT